MAVTNRWQCMSGELGTDYAHTLDNPFEILFALSDTGLFGGEFDGV